MKILQDINTRFKYLSEKYAQKNTKLCETSTEMVGESPRRLQEEMIPYVWRREEKIKHH